MTQEEREKLEQEWKDLSQKIKAVEFIDPMGRVKISNSISLKVGVRSKNEL